MVELDSNRSRDVKLRRIVAAPAQAAESVHHFIWARHGNEFILEVGHIDFLAAHKQLQAVEEGKEPEIIDLVIIHRLSLSEESVKRLADAVQQMNNSLAEKTTDAVSG